MLNQMLSIQQMICSGERTALGIELGSTRIKAVLIDADFKPLASGSHDWQNRMENGFWTYSLADVWNGIQNAFAKLSAQVQTRYDVTLRRVGSLGVSGMMHGYLAFDSSGRLLAPFRTWRNTTTGPAAAELTRQLNFNIPQRWSVSHLYQAILNEEPHVREISFLTTLAGYVHWQLSNQRVLGIGDASGMFPVDNRLLDYDNNKIALFDEILKERKLPLQLRKLLPRVVSAGQAAGFLSESGSLLLDPTGTFESGIMMCPPEGDAGTGMVATNSISIHTGNISAGTSIFAMAVLEKPLTRMYQEIDIVATPSGAPVAMVHCNTCTSELDSWVNLLGEMASAAKANLTKAELYDLLYQKAMEASPDCGGLVAFNYFSGEPITAISHGRPLLVRDPDSSLTLANLMRAQIYSAVATLKIGMNILFEKEGVKLDCLLGHGGLFKTEKVGQQLVSDALGVPVSVMENAGEGGPWGMAILASYAKNRAPEETLESFLRNRVFSLSHGFTTQPNPVGSAGFASFLERYQRCLVLEQAASEALQNRIE